MPRRVTRISELGLGGVTSLVAHVVFFVVLALLQFSQPDQVPLPEVDSRWVDTSLPLEVQEVEFRLPDTGDPPGGGQGPESAPLETSKKALVPSGTEPRPTLPSLALFSAPAWSASDLTTTFKVPKSGSGRGQGTGIGDGMGLGTGREFFGLNPQPGQRIIYLVDNSRSMNHPHDSPAKTRFKRVQIEIVNSIWHMDAHQQFYVIFFNDGPEPMPGRLMQPATPFAKEHFLTWVAERRAGGAPTDPREAVELALSFRPDIIYFLTDGEFGKLINQRLLKIRQQEIAIHTFAFGNETSEEVLRTIAANNRGKFTIIP